MDNDILQRFTAHLKDALARAIDAASEYKQAHVTPGLLIYGLTEQSGSIGAEVLQNSNISGSQEVYVMARGKQDAHNINNVNSPAGKMIKKQREAVIRRKGRAEDLDFKDRKMNLASQTNSQLRGRRR